MTSCAAFPTYRCAPADSLELEAQLHQAVTEGKPTYIRIGKKGEPDLFADHESLGIGKANLLKQGQNILLIGVGPIISEALKASMILEQQGIQLAVASMGSVKPLDHNFLKLCVANNYSHWISLEEHHQTGGLGSALLEWLSEEQVNTVRLKRIGISDHFVHQLGPQNYVRETEGLNAASIVEQVQSL